MMSASEPRGEPTLTGTFELDGGRPRPAPARVGRYEIREQLGCGSMGVVYRARDPELERDVAIKVVRTSDAHPASELRLLREAQAMARLRHPNVVPIFDVGPADGGVFVAMPLLEGGTLRHWLRGGAHTFDAILDRFVAAGRGLAAAHAAGLIHRDFKPENVLLGDDGETQVADFGLACLAHDEQAPSTSAIRLAAGALTETGTVLGTPAYMAPEQLRGLPSDARADQFSFCVAVWEGVYGVRPFAAYRSSASQPVRRRLQTIAAGPLPPPRRARHAWIAGLLRRGLDSDPERRWPSMQALLDAIAAARGPRRWPSRLALGLCPAALVLAGAMWSHPNTLPPRVFRTVQLTHRGDLSNAALSPDGTQLALVAGDSLLLRGIAADAEDLVLVEHGIGDGSISWSPDGQRLLVDTVPDVVGVLQTELVDVYRGAQYKLPATGISTFLSSHEIAVTSYRQRSVEIYPLGDHATAITTCRVPGDYTFIWSLSGMPDGTMIVETLKGETHALVVLRRSCEVRATYSAERITSVAVSDTGTVVTLVVGPGFGEILEISLDGEVVSRRAVSGELSEVIGRRHGADYVLALSLKTHLDRAHGMAPPVRQFSVSGSASFSLSPDGKTLAWIEHDGRVRPRGPLRLSTLDGLARRGSPLVDHAVSASWSPDGRRLAAVTDDDTAGIMLVIVDRTGTTRRLPLAALDRGAQPVWLDARRVAARSDDLTVYEWFDLETGDHGELGDRAHGSTYWLTRSPRDGTLAMWRNGRPGAITAQTEHLWLIAPGHDAAPLHVDDAARHYLLPSWSSSGELVVRALDTGMVSQVALDTGALTPIARLPVMRMHSSLNHEHVLALPDGDLLAVNTEPGLNVSVVEPEDAVPGRYRVEPTLITP
jgi:serine/threonine protein kinase/dipeptidyl aminopeptidase/acylaminoacyl peptidase